MERIHVAEPAEKDIVHVFIWNSSILKDGLQHGPVITQKFYMGSVEDNPLRYE
jgi:hypothetical protein